MLRVGVGLVRGGAGDGEAASEPGKCMSYEEEDTCEAASEPPAPPRTKPPAPPRTKPREAASEPAPVRLLLLPFPYVWT